MLQNSNKILTILLFISIYYTTIVYSAFDTRLQIEGDAVVRTDQSIRITNLEISNTVNDAYEEYNSKYGKDTTSMYLILPASSSITYTIEITNKVSDSYLIDSIDEISNTNNNVGVDLSLNVNDVVNSNSTKTFTITITNDTLSEQNETLVIEYGFKINRFTLTINPNGGMYNNTTSISTIQQGYNTYYGLNTPTREGYTFDGWELSGSGDVVRGDSSGYGYPSSEFTYTSKIDTDGSFYSNYKFNFTPNEIKYECLIYPHYSFVVGHTYRLISTIRVNEYSNLRYFEIRNSAVYNDWDTPGRKSIMLPSSKEGTGWTTYIIDRTFDSSTTTHVGSTVNVSPLFEIWFAVNANTNGKVDFDIKNVIIEDMTDGTQISNDTYNGYIYKFGSENATLTAKWVTTMNNNVVEYDYTGNSQEFIAPKSGTYKIELWGAQGGTVYVNKSLIGGYGGYSIGNINLIKGKELYVSVGGAGNICNGLECSTSGGYNGGASVYSYSGCGEGQILGAGGGATHISENNNLEELKNYSNNRSNVLIVSGGGGGSNYCNTWNYAAGGHGGGKNGVNSIDKGAAHFIYNGGPTSLGGSQDSGNTFGIGSSKSGGAGGGGGWYGGIGTGINGAGGGSGYIGNQSLSNKAMYCYDCEEATNTTTDIDIFTVSTTGTTQYIDSINCPDGYSSLPISKCAKAGNGYARITFIE